MKQLAADADARWEAKPKVMEEGGGENMLPEGQQRMEEVSQQQKEGKGVAQEQDPWKKARATGPGEKWQPKAWTPTGTKS
jgi:NADH dehydrogenase [ubiquinone] 1 alpha subcomplex assembly factor 2